MPTNKNLQPRGWTAFGWFDKSTDGWEAHGDLDVGAAAAAEECLLGSESSAVSPIGPNPSVSQ